MAEFSIPSSFEPTNLLQHYHISKKAAVLGTIHYLQDHHLPTQKLEIYCYFNVSRQTGSRWVAKNEPRKIHNYPDSGPDVCG